MLKTIFACEGLKGFSNFSILVLESFRYGILVIADMQNKEKNYGTKRYQSTNGFGRDV